MSDETTTAPKQQRRRLPDDVKAVLTEMDAQDARWGEQNHPMHGGMTPGRSRLWFAQEAHRWQATNAKRARQGNIGWDGILLEEVFEALGEHEVEAQIRELEQVAAVAINQARSLKRQNGL